MWRNHFYICLILIVLSVPIYLLDRFFLKPGAGGWITIDFRGVLINAYLLLMILHIVISTIAIHFFSSITLISTHISSGVVSVIIFIAGIYMYSTAERYSDRKRYEARMEARRSLKDVIQLKHWRFIPDEDNVTEIHADIMVTESGRFSGNVTAYDDSEHQYFLFQSGTVTQLNVSAGDSFTFIFPIEKNREGNLGELELTFYLFKDSTGTASENITKVYCKEFTAEDDGTYFYAVLPPPVIN